MLVHVIELRAIQFRNNLTKKDSGENKIGQLLIKGPDFLQFNCFEQPRHSTKIFSHVLVLFDIFYALVLFTFVASLPLKFGTGNLALRFLIMFSLAKRVSEISLKLCRVDALTPCACFAMVG